MPSDGVKHTENQHPLHGKDEQQCYEVMMAERSTLIAARLSSEEALLKTIIQLSAAILTAIAGFVSVYGLNIFQNTEIKTVVLFLVISILICIIEYRLSSIAYGKQISVIVDFYTMKSHSLDDPRINRYVSLLQWVALASFFVAMLGLAVFSWRNVEFTNGKHPQTTSAKSNAGTKVTR